MFKKFKKKIGYLVGVITTFVVVNSQFAFADVAGAMGGVVENGMNIVAAIPGAMAIFSFINAGIAFSQAQQEGGNAQASAKMSNSIVAGVVCILLAAAILGPFKGLVSQLTSAG